MFSRSETDTCEPVSFDDRDASPSSGTLNIHGEYSHEQVVIYSGIG